MTPVGPNSSDATPDRKFACPQEDPGVGKFNPRRIFFSDGGFFDNVPLGLAGVMVPADEAGQRQPAQYWYVNSDIRRSSRKSGERPPIGGDGLGFLAGWLGRGIAEARSYELQTLARYRPEWFGFGRSPDKPCPPGSSCFHVIDRFAPLVGDYLSSFGAFANRSFRMYDYYAGVYDGLMNVAGSADTDLEQQFLLWYPRVLRPDGEVSDPVGESIVQMLALWEHPDWKPTLADKFPLATSATACNGEGADPRRSLPVLVLDTLKLISDERERLHASGNVQAVMEFNQNYESALGFWGFVGLLGQRVRQVGARLYERRCDASEKEKTALRDLPGGSDAGDLDGWTAQQGNALARRLIEVEKADRRRPQPDRPNPGEDGEEPLANPCYYGHVALCVRDVIPNSIDLVRPPSVGDAMRTNLGWQTSLFPLATPNAPSGKQLLLRLRFVHTLALQQAAHPSDRLTAGLGYANGVDPAASSVDLAAVAYRFPTPAGRGPFTICAEDWSSRSNGRSFARACSIVWEIHPCRAPTSIGRCSRLDSGISTCPSGGCSAGPIA